MSSVTGRACAGAQVLLAAQQAGAVWQRATLERLAAALRDNLAVRERLLAQARELGAAQAARAAAEAAAAAAAAGALQEAPARPPETAVRSTCPRTKLTVMFKQAHGNRAVQTTRSCRCGTSGSHHIRACAGPSRVLTAVDAGSSFMCDLITTQVGLVCHCQAKPASWPARKVKASAEERQDA